MAILNITKDNFENEVLHSDKPMLVDFWASWCMPCKMLSPVVDEVAEENAESISVGKVNVDEQPELASMFGVSSIPMLILFKDGQPVRASVGAVPKSSVEELIK